MSAPEPWLSGPLPGVDPLLAPAVFALRQVGEDLEKFTAGLDARVWESPHGLAPLGFQLKHIAGSVERLCAYAGGRQLTDEQLAWQRAEMEPGASLPELMGRVRDSLDQAESFIRGVDPARLGEPREVGRKRLPTTLIGLIVHLAEHAQRHLGQAIVTARLLRREPPDR